MNSSSDKAPERRRSHELEAVVAVLQTQELHFATVDLENREQLLGLLHRATDVLLALNQKGRRLALVRVRNR